MEHFFCAQCGKQFGEEGFHEREGKPYCRDDYFDMFAPKCGACNRAIMENYISALNAQWHPECFVCRVRSINFIIRNICSQVVPQIISYQADFYCSNKVNFLFFNRIVNWLCKANLFMPWKVNLYALNVSALMKKKRIKLMP